MNELSGRIFTSNQSGTIRVISADEIEVFYEPWSSVGGYYTNTQSAIFGRFGTKYFNNNFIESEEIYENQNHDIDLYYPNLPLRLLRFQNLFWSTSPFDSVDSASRFCIQNNISIDNNIVLPTKEIYLNPISALGRMHNGPLIIALREEGFTIEELFYHAYKIQSEHVKPEQSFIQYQRYGPTYSGIGMFRSGIRSNKPSFYLCAYHDLAMNTLRAETADSKENSMK